MRSQLVLGLGFAACTWACQRELNTFPTRTHRKPIAKRDETWPPVLTENEAILVNSFDNNTVDQWSDYYGHQYHLAGKGQATAQWTSDRWNENGVDAQLHEYQVFLNYPQHQALQVTWADGTSQNVKIEEDMLPEDDTTDRPDRIPTFHGYSATGNATAEYVYVGRGTLDDYQRLVDLGVDLKGKIALSRYGGPFRGLKVKNAQQFGMLAAVLYSDPADDHGITVANGYEAYPDGPARNPSAVQRGSVMFLSTRPGDPTTPGYPSLEGAPRDTNTSSVLPEIPSIPVSYSAAEPLLQALNGHGKTAKEVNRPSWVGSLDADYSSGPAPGVTLSLQNLMEGGITPIWDVIGVINGTNADETIVVGNHRDAWIIGGNADPNSGSSILVELTKAINKLRATGWKPRRNIVLASWDAEEYGLVGSTEWVEEYAGWLKDTAVAYLNIDVGVSGPWPDVSTTPELHNLSTQTMKKIIHPNYGSFNRTLYDAWVEASGGSVGILGSGSDYTAFLHHGISSLDTGSGEGHNDPIYHYHSDYDSYHWMSTFGDPGFHVHVTMGQYLTLLLYHLADDEVLPIDVQTYAVELRAYYDNLVDYIAQSGVTLDTSELSDAIDEFKKRADQVKALEARAVRSNNKKMIRKINHRYRDFQRGFVSQGGLPDREFYKHVVVAPGLDTGYAAVTYPGITEGVEYGHLQVAQEWVGKTARGILAAADILA